MSFLPIPFTDRETDDGLGSGLINGLARAMRRGRSAFAIGHTLGTEASGGGGEHTTDRNISKGRAKVKFDGGTTTYSIAKGYGIIQSVSRIAEGHCRVTLSHAMAEPYRAWAGATLSARAVVVDSTTVDVFLRNAIQEAGGAYTWDDQDGDFWIKVDGDLAAHPPTPGDEWWPALSWADWSPFTTIVPFADLNALITQHVRARLAFLRRHDEDGEHDDPLISRAWAFIAYNPVEDDYFISAQSGIIGSINMVSAGVVDITLSSAMEDDCFVGHYPAGGVLTAGDPGLAPLGGTLTSASQTSGTVVRVSVFGPHEPIRAVNGSFFVEVSGELA
jgi:hypothetical protein